MRPLYRQPALTLERAEALALDALGFIAGEERTLLGLIAESGLTPAALPGAAQDPAFLGGVLDFLLRDEPLLLEFCAAQNLPPELPQKARRLLPGATVE